MSTQSPSPPQASLLKEQYVQYHEMLRQWNAFTWQIPSIFVAVLVLFFGLGPSNIADWQNTPLLPCLGSLFLSLFALVMLVFQRHNSIFLDNVQNILRKMEEDHGEMHDVYWMQIDPTKKWCQRIRSSFLLSCFLTICFVVFLPTFFVYFAMAIK